MFNIYLYDFVNSRWLDRNIHPMNNYILLDKTVRNIFLDMFRCNSIQRFLEDTPYNRSDGRNNNYLLDNHRFHGDILEIYQYESLSVIQCDYNKKTLMDHFFCLGFFPRESFPCHMEPWPLPKGCKFWPIRGHWAVKVIWVPHLLWNGTSVYNGHLWQYVILTLLIKRLAVVMYYMFYRLRSVAAGIRITNLSNARRTFLLTPPPPRIL